jgi:hypothetical protein
MPKSRRGKNRKRHLRQRERERTQRMAAGDEIEVERARQALEASRLRIEQGRPR